MIERLFFDGIDLDGSGRGVTEAVEFAAAIDADEAEAGLPFSDVAVARAEVAMKSAVRVGVPPASFVLGFGWSKNLEWHDGIALL